VDVRILTATHKNLEKEVNDGRFRADLFYRIRVARIRVPPLRERLDDIPLLVASFLTQAQASIDKVINQISMEAMRCLQSYHWPGNVRELKNAIEYAIIHSRQGIIRPKALPPEILQSIDPKSKTFHQPATNETIEFEGDEETRLLKALEKANGNRSRAARLLKMSRSHFYRRLKACGISFRK